MLALQTTRLSPSNVSANIQSDYKNFNLGLHVGDCAKQVEYNRHCLQNLLPPNTSIQWLEQVHGNTVIDITRVTKQTLIGDAMITRKRNTALAIMTADCLPILLVSNKGNEIAAIHGGWRPLAGNIITNTVKKMHTGPDKINAWLGPCIGSDAFEVGGEVKKVFVEQGSLFSKAFRKQNNGKYLANLHEIATTQLNSLGIKHVNTLPECTYSKPEKYYSYRKKSTTGRMATVITIL